MFNIGDFAKHGRVSVRMLRHYDAIGLLRPARVDPASGYRFYEAAQLARLNRVIALKDLGFTLHQVLAVLDDRVDAAELRGMLRLRRAELAAAMAADARRLARVEARLRTIESEGTMSAHDVVVKRVPSVRVAELTGVAASYEPEEIGPVIGPLFAELCRRLAEAGVAEAGPSVARYEDVPDGDGAVLIRVAVPVSASLAVEGSTASRWSTCRRSRRRRPSCTAGRWTTRWVPSRRWPASSTRTATVRRGTPGRCTWSARTPRRTG